MDEQVIQCPTCGKRYRMKGTPPPTFECRGCETVMDLSGFREAAPPPAAPPPSSQHPHRGEAPVHTRHAGRRGFSGARARGRHAHAPEGEGGHHHHYTHKEPGPSKGMIWGSIAFFVIAGIALLFYMQAENRRKAEEAAREKAEQEAILAAQQAAREEMLAQAPDETDEVAPPPEIDAPKPEPENVEDARPELREGSLLSIPIPEGKTRYKPREAKVQTYEWPEHVTAEERNKIEKAIEDMIETGGRDGRDAEEYLVSLDKDQEDGAQFKAMGRMIGEFKNMLDAVNWDDRLTMAKFMTLDRALRKVDGMQERDFRDIDGININSTDTDVGRVAKRWNWWYDLEKWRLRREPWDVRFDVLDDEAFEDLEAN